jgi:hypothetical protein
MSLALFRGFSLRALHDLKSHSRFEECIAICNCAFVQLVAFTIHPPLVSGLRFARHPLPGAEGNACVSIDTKEPGATDYRPTRQGSVANHQRIL